MATYTLELYLSPENLEDTLENIEKGTGIRPVPFYSHPRPGFELFYSIRVPKTPGKNEWDWARELTAYDGVLEADPVKTLMGLTLPQNDSYNSDEDYPEYRQLAWNHVQTSFPEAIKKSVAQGKLDTTRGTGIKVAHFDTGVSRHQALGSIINYGINFIEEGSDPIDPLTDEMQHPGHGTSTSGIIIGSGKGGPNPDIFNKGVFPYVDLIPYRISNSVVHILRPGFIADAIIDAVDKGCAVITMSMGGAPPTRRWLEAVEYAYKNGVIFCSAAGNDVGFVVWPARYSQVFAIAGLNINREPWEGSCHGKSVILSAPGENVYVCRARMGDSAISYDYSFGSGTSFATPHVAAAAALWLNHFGAELSSLPQKHMIPDAFRWALEKSATGFPSGLNGYGKGVLNAELLLDYGPLDYKNELNSAPLRAGHGFLLTENGTLLSSTDKEMLDLIVNNSVNSIEELECHIDSVGSGEAQERYYKLKSERAGFVDGTSSAKNAAGSKSFNVYKAGLINQIL